MPLIFMDLGDPSIFEARCPKCGTSYQQEALTNGDDQRCPYCGVSLETKNSYHNGKGNGEAAIKVLEYKTKRSGRKDTAKEESGE